MTGSRKIKSFARFLPLGDHAVTVEFGAGIDVEISARVTAATAAIRAAGFQGIREIVPTFRSVGIFYDQAVTPQAALIEAIGDLDVPDLGAKTPGRTWTIPVLYGGDTGPDLDDVARATGMTPPEAAALHASGLYHVYMLGFLPGFAYLGDLPGNLRLPRLTVPRTRVPAGSVAIAEQMTAVYPAQSPGGWHLIGRTPLLPFDHRAHPPSLFSAGDHVKFEAVDQKEFDRISRAVETGSYRPEASL